MLKKILSVIGGITVVGAIVGYLTMGTKVGSLHPDAMGYYMKMFNDVLETGNSAAAMTRKVKVKDGISPEDIVETMNSIAEENNFLVVGDSKMNINSSIKKTGNKDDRYIRILSYCSPGIAKKFINYSKEYGAFMPCRVMIVEDDEGNLWLETMAMELMLYGGKPLPKDMLEMAQSVRKTMYTMMDSAATGDF